MLPGDWVRPRLPYRLYNQHSGEQLRLNMLQGWDCMPEHQPWSPGPWAPAPLLRGMLCLRMSSRLLVAPLENLQRSRDAHNPLCQHSSCHRHHYGAIRTAHQQRRRRCAAGGRCAATGVEG